MLIFVTNYDNIMNVINIRTAARFRGISSAILNNVMISDNALENDNLKTVTEIYQFKIIYPPPPLKYQSVKTQFSQVAIVL